MFIVVVAVGAVFGADVVCAGVGIVVVVVAAAVCIDVVVVLYVLL